MIISCPHCGNQISDKAEKCVHCNAVLKQNDSYIQEDYYESCDMQVKICAECGNTVANTCTICNVCGNVLAEQPSNIDIATQLNLLNSEKEKEDHEQQLQKLRIHEKKLAQYVEKTKKPFHIIDTIFSSIGAVFGGACILLHFALMFNSGKAIMPIFQLLTPICLIFAVTNMIISNFFKEFTPIFSAGKVRQKVAEEKFNYIKYCKHLKIYKRGRDTGLVEAKQYEKGKFQYSIDADGSFHLIQALHYKDTPSAVIFALLRVYISACTYTVAAILFYIGIQRSISSLADYDLSLGHYAYWISGFVVLVAGFFIEQLFDTKKKSIIKWVFYIKDSFK